MADAALHTGATGRGTDAPQAAPSEPAWPSVHGRHPVEAEPASVVDSADATAWAMPYTDLTMLLMVFFIVMLSIVGPDPTDASDPSKTTEGGGATVSLDAPSDTVTNPGAAPPSPIARGDGILPERALVLPSRPETGGTADAPSDGAAGPTADPPEKTTEAPPEDDFAHAWARRVNGLEVAAIAFLDAAGLGDTITLDRTETGIELRLPDHLLFSSGSAEVQTEGIELLWRIAAFLIEIDGAIEVSGHTDDVPISTVRFPSNWELSAARAIAVVRLLRQMEVPATKMQAVGHGSNRPIASNSHAVGRAINRRVTIDVTPRPSPPGPAR